MDARAKETPRSQKFVDVNATAPRWRIGGPEVAQVGGRAREGDPELAQVR